MATLKLSKGERLEKGQIEVQAILEIVGKPKEHVEQTLKDYIGKIKEDEKYEITEDFVDEAIEKDGMFTTYADLKFWAKDIEAMIGFCFDYMPSSVEIIEPEKKIMEMNIMSNMLNDLQARLHHTDMLARTMFEQNKIFNETVNNLIKNFVTVILSRRSHNMKDISQLTGVSEETLKNFLDKMVEEKKIKEENGVYHLIG